MINIEDLEDLRFEKLAFRQRIYEKSDEFGVLRFEKLAFGQLRSKKLAFSQRICEKSGDFRVGVANFGLGVTKLGVGVPFLCDYPVFLKI